jgi:hypothetical protein
VTFRFSCGAVEQGESAGDYHVAVSPAVVAFRAMPTPTPKRGRGRPPKGPGGTRVRDLPTLSIRLSAEPMALLRAASKISLLATSDVIAAALAAWVRTLPRAERADIERQAARELAARGED